MDAISVIAYFIAIAVPAFTVYLFVMLDAFGTGKPSTILLCVAWGASGAFVLAWLLNNTVMDWGVTYETLTRSTAPIIEEFVKALVLIALIQRPRFRYIVDGAVYGIAVGIGFALSENVLIYLPDAGATVLATAITRTLSTSLMHATASGLVGISLGRIRRTTNRRAVLLPVIGIVIAIALHVAYNNLAHELAGVTLLLVAIAFGFTGGGLIASQISRGLAEEKTRFAETLGLTVGVSEAEREAVQNLGGVGIEEVFDELQAFFGQENVMLVRRLLVLQANIGILRNNLSGPASERLRTAWENEIAQYRAEFEQIRRKLGKAVNLFVDTVFPPGDQAMQDAFNDELARFDPTLLHTFDMFMRVSELAAPLSPDELTRRAERLCNIEIFRFVPTADLENLSRAITTRDFEDGTVLFNEGDQGDAMYLLEQGQIDIFVTEQQTGRQKLLRTFDPGGVVGEFALLDGEPRSARAEARGQIRVLVLQREAFYRFIQSRPDVVLVMLRYLADKVRLTTQTVETSIEYLMQLGRGDYAPLLPAAAHDNLPTEPDIIAADPASLEPAALSDETPHWISSIFSRIALQLQNREASITDSSSTKQTG